MEEIMRNVGARVPVELDRLMDEWVDRSLSLGKGDLILLAVCRYLKVPTETQNGWIRAKKKGARA